MATDLEDKQGVYDDAEHDRLSNDPTQSYYNNEFNRLTSPDHLAKDADEPEKAASPEQLKGDEEAGAGSTAASTGLSAEAGLLAGATAAAGFFNPATDIGKLGKVKNFFWGSSLRKKGTVGTGIAGISIGGLMFAAVIGSGPFEFIHLAQLLTQFHFANMQDASDDRTSKLFRFLDYTKGKPQNARMGVLGNKLANTIEAKMNATGIQSAYTDEFGNFDGYVIDRSKIANTDMSDLQGKSPDEIKSYVQTTYKVPPENITVFDGKVWISADGLGYFKSRGLLLAMMKESGFSKISSVLGARIMGRRAGISWHPLKRLDSKVQNSLANWWKNRNSEVENGAEPEITAEADPNANKTESPGQSDATAAQDEAGSVTQEAQTASTAANNGDTSGVDTLKSHIGAKVTAGGAALVAVACLAHGIAKNADNIKQTEVVLPMLRMGMEAITVGNQVMNGDDVNTDELGLLSKQLSSTAGDWSNAQSIQAEEGQSLTGVDANSTMKSVGQTPPFNFLVTGTMGSALGTLCSTPVTIGLTIVSFLGGPITAVASLVAGFASAPLIDSFSGDLAHWLVGKAIDPATLAGPDYGNAVNFGARLAADNQAIAAGGTTLTNAQSAQLKTTETLASQQQFDSQSLAYRVFNPYDSRTLTSHLIDSISPSTTQNVASLMSGFTHIGSLITSSFGSIFNGITHADPPTPYDYGFPEYGFSESDLNNPLVENPFKNAEAAATILDNNNNQNGSGEPDYITLANQCFGVSLIKTPDPDNNNTPTWDVSGGTTTPKLSDISQHDCARTGDNDWLRIRFFIFDTENMEAIGCYENDAESCDDIDMNNGGGDAVSYNLQQMPSKTNSIAIATNQKSHVSKTQDAAVRMTAQTLSSTDSTANTFWRNTIRGMPAYAAAA